MVKISRRGLVIFIKVQCPESR